MEKEPWDEWVDEVWEKLTIEVTPEKEGETGMREDQDRQKTIAEFAELFDGGGPWRDKPTGEREWRVAKMERRRKWDMSGEMDPTDWDAEPKEGLSGTDGLKGIDRVDFIHHGWWERWEREIGEGGWMLVSTWKASDEEVSKWRELLVEHGSEVY